MILRDRREPRRAAALTKGDTAAQYQKRAATFFLGWLILAASMSVAGNVGHALLMSPSDTRELAALGALVPPIVLLAATHSAAWLVRARSVGWVYWVALALTAALAVGSFALSFDALRSFAVMLGIRESLSWIWPAVIDVAIAHASLCLLSLSTPMRATETERSSVDTEALLDTAKPDAVHLRDISGTSAPDHPDEPQPFSANPPMPLTAQARHSARSAPRIEPGFAAAPSLPSAGPAGEAVVGPPRCPDRPLTAVPARKPDPTSVMAISPAAAGPNTQREETVEHWQPVAESLVRDGVTTKDASLIARILADNAAGTPPTTIGRRHDVHHSTVTRILSAAEQVSELAPRRGPGRHGVQGSDEQEGPLVGRGPWPTQRIETRRTSGTAVSRA